MTTTFRMDSSSGWFQSRTG